MRKRTKISRSSAVGLTAMAALFANGVAMANCEPAWDENVGNPGLSGGNYVSSFATFDAGNGEQLYAAGGFTSPATRVARWDGEVWHDVGFDLMTSGWLNDAITFNGHLYVAGNNNLAGGLARYDGTDWTVPGGGIDFTDGLHSVSTMALFDDGSGEALYIGGAFDRADGEPMNFIAKWDGEEWHDVGGGLSGPARVMAVWDGSLYVAGLFNQAGSTFVNRVARWDGEEWHDVGGGVTSSTYSDMVVWDDGSGEALYITGNTMSGPVVGNIVRWDGQAWSVPGGAGPTGWGRGLAVYDDGDGEQLYMMGGISGQDHVMLSRWDGQQWEEIPDRLYDGSSALTGFVWDDGHGEALFVGGSFERSASNIASSYVAAWRGCPVCIADWNGDGEVDINDFFAYLSDFEDGNPRADLNNDGEIDINDFFIFLQEFEEGC